MRFCWIHLFCFCSIVCCAKGQCNARNQDAASKSKRPCRRSCVPKSSVQQYRCSPSFVCTCDHECGYSCIPRENYCRPPSPVENSREVTVRRRSSNGSLVLVSDNRFKYNDVAEYVCKPGYKRDFPIMQHLCHARRGWTGMTVCILSCQRYSFVGVRRNNMRCGRRCKIDGDCRGILKCRCDGYCSRRCVNPNINCGNAPTARNADLTYTGSGIERKAQYRCREGFYHESGNTARRCTGGGTWDGQAVSCQRITCGDPRPSIQATGGDVINWRRGPYRVGQSFTFRCPQTHAMLGSRVRTCLSNGRWSGLLTVCDGRGERIRCRHPGVPINGRITSINNLEVGSFVEFQCNPGYSMYGDARQECLYFLQWSDDGAPKCINPRYPFGDKKVVDKLLQTAEAPSIGKTITRRRSLNIEAYFVIDISDDVSDEALRKSLEFAEERIRNMSRNGKIRCEISAFASERAVLLDLETTTTEEAINNLNNAEADRLNILESIGAGRNTYRAIEGFNASLSVSFSEDQDKTRFVFLFVKGLHTQGESPNVAMDNVRSTYEGYLLEIYVIAFGDEFQNDQTLNELQSLAPKGNFFPNPPADLFLTSQSGESETDYSDCGRAGDVRKIKNRVAVGKVVGGSFAIDGAWPWQVAFAYRRQSIYLTYNSPISVFGGGSLINNEWVITAAHIFFIARQLPNWPQNIILTLGTTRLLSNRSSDLSPHTRVFLPERVIIHENYVEGTYDYDIALVKLGKEQIQFGDIWLPSQQSGRVEYSKRIQRVCLPCTENNCVGKYLRKIGKLNGNEGKEESCRIEGEWLIQEGDSEVIEEKNILTAVTGFGYTDESEPVTSNHLKQGLIRLRNRNRCSRDRDLMTRHTPPLPERVAFTERMTCGIGGGLNSVVDSCTGDSGGPLVREIIDEETGESCWVLVGLVSWGLNCATSYIENNTKRYFPGFYSKTIPFTQWISQNLLEDEQCQERNTANLAPGQRCRKRCRTVIDCGRGSKQCICDDECGMSCINPDIPCVHSDTFENGFVTGANLAYRSTITHTCNRGYVLEGVNQRTCRSDRKYSGKAPICRQQLCLVPRAPRFGAVSTSERFVMFGENVTFSCSTQYEIEGRSLQSLTVTCQSNGVWSRNIPTCREVRCTVPDPPEFGSVSKQGQLVLVGEVVTYTCNSGYEMVNQPTGRLIVACLRNGEWSNDVPQCRDLDRRCPVPNAPRFGTVSTNERFVLFGESITFTCNSQYEIVGRSSTSLTVECERNGGWSDEIPTCREIRCTVPQPPSFGSVSPRRGSLSVGGAITYSCNAGYEIVNQPSEDLTVTCLRTRQWSSGVPQCREIRCIVPEPPLAFGSVFPSASSLSVGKTLTYSCNPGYEMVDQPSNRLIITCLESKEWSNEVPSCRETRCVVPEPPAFGSVSSPANALSIGRTLTYSCNPGYEMIDQPSGRLTVTCLRSKQWSNGVPKCRMIGCLIPELPGYLFGSVSPQASSLPVGKTITYSCNPGYEMIGRPSGSLTVTCLRNRQWSNRVPECREILCLILDPPAFGSVSSRKNSLPEGETITYSCNLGYEMVDQLSEIRCIVPNPPAFGSVSSRVSSLPQGETIIYSCNPGYEMVGQPSGRLTVKCLESRQWSNSVPTCSVIGCLIPEPPAFGSVSPRASSFPVGRTITYSCNPGYEMIGRPSGSLTVTCLRNRQWSNRVPRCREIRCFIPDPPSFGSVSSSANSLPLGGTITYSCNPGYEMVGQPSGRLTVKCLESRQWSNSVPTCRVIGCLIPEPPAFGSVSPQGSSLPVGETITYFCNPGYEMVGQPSGTLTVSCLRSRQWSNRVPQCRGFSECGQAGDVGNIRSRRRVRRAVGGEDARPGAWPWHVLVGLRGSNFVESYSQQNIYGGGSIINNKWILTVARVILRFNQTNPQWINDVRLTLGMHQRPTSAFDTLPSTVQIFGANKIITDPQFSLQTYDYNVALIKVGQRFSWIVRPGLTRLRGNLWLSVGPATDVTIQFTNSVRPVCLPCMNSSCIGEESGGVSTGVKTEAESCIRDRNVLLQGTESNNANAVLTGFGYTQPSQFELGSLQILPQYLQQVLLQVRSIAYCATLANVYIPREYPGASFTFTRQIICADSSRNARPGDACFLDGGSPLVREVVNPTTGGSCWVQIGIVSTGLGCAQTINVGGRNVPLPGFYSNVIELMPWIKRVINTN